jgi:arylsulfatase A-like enzyme
MKLKVVFYLLFFLLLSCNKTTYNYPNIIIFLTDDQGWGDLSFHGNTNIQTPNIDNIAKNGVSFNRFYVSPVCSPTRAELLTGKYFVRSGVNGVTKGYERMNIEHELISDFLKKENYNTGLFGKWHNGSQPPYHPNNRGFNEFYGFTAGHWGDYFNPVLENNGKIVRGDGYIIDDITNKSISFMEIQIFKLLILII